MKKIIFLFSLAIAAAFGCQKTNLVDPLASLPTQEEPSANDRSCTLEITPLFGAGNNWFATIQAEGANVAKICGTGYNVSGYTKVDWNTTFSVPGGGAFKKYKIIQSGQNATFNVSSDAGCFDLSCVPGSSYPFFAGCATSGCDMTVKINSTTNLNNWLAEVRRVNETCTEELVTTIGGAASGADLYFHTGAPNLLAVDGFKVVSIKQLVGNVNYTLGAPSAGYAPLLPSATFTVNAGSTASRRLGCSN